MERHPMYGMLSKYTFEQTPGGQEEVGGPQDITNNFSIMGAGQRNLLCCDEIFSLYLRKISTNVSKEYYFKVLSFVLMFREALNKFGWEKKAENDLREGKNNAIGNELEDKK